MVANPAHPQEGRYPFAPAPAAAGRSLFRPPAWLARLLRSNRRQAARLTELAGFARVDGVLVRVRDLSRGGMQLVGYRGLLDQQDRFPFSLSVAFALPGPADTEPVLEISGEALVAWRRGDRMGVAFYRMEPQDRAKLDRLLSELMEKLDR